MSGHETGIVIVGAGAAGLMAAAELADGGGRAALIERGREVGRKVLASGGGRCNFTHLATPDDFLAAFGARAARFLKHAVHDLPPQALRDWFRSRGLESVVEADQCVFPASSRARDVLSALFKPAGRPAVELHTEVECTAVVVQNGRATGLETSAGRLAASRVILATGGRAWPQAGGSDSGAELLRQVGHTVVPARPGLAPLYLDNTAPDAREPTPPQKGGAPDAPAAARWLRELQGVALDRARLSWGRSTSEGPLVFTHFGLSGPAALDLSLHLSRLPATVSLAVLPGAAAGEVEARLVAAATRDGRRPMAALLAEELPRRLVRELLAALAVPPDTAVGQLRRDDRRRVAAMLTAAPVRVARVGDWREAMVTVGGCALGEVDPRTMESRLVRGLYVVGELLDVAGPTGGYNLHAAFATARLAARAAHRAGHG